MQITPFVLGSGKAAQAITESLKVLEIVHPDITLLPVQKLKRNQNFAEAVIGATHPVLFIANPHALHAQAILEGEAAGFKLIVCEKPGATSKEQIAALEKVTTPVAICHGYRQMWGIQTLKKMLDQGEFGEIISLEGRYWQSSSAQKALLQQKSTSWKNDQNLSGPSDVLFDIATHWADAVIFLAGTKPEKLSLWRSYKNAEASHRDTHVHLQMEFPGGYRAMGSISKTVHGAPNHFEINVIGTKKYACWKFLEQDLLEVSSGATRSLITRDSTNMGSGHWPHHSLGWIEGYIEVIYQALKGGSYPTLKENLSMMELLLE
jgi:predicted dehydrogenase